jgi:hypothetical protein
MGRFAREQLSPDSTNDLQAQRLTMESKDGM